MYPGGGRHRGARLTRYFKETYVCDRKDCGAVHERLQNESMWMAKMPAGWSGHDGKHYCQKHRIVVSVLDVVGEKGSWTEEK